MACVIIAIGYAVSPFMMRTTAGVLVVCIAIQTGVTFAFGVIPILLMSDAPREQTGAVNGFNMLARTVGTSIAGAVLGAVLANLMTNYDGKPVTSLSGFCVCLCIGCVAALAAGLATIPMERHQEEG